MIDLYTDDYFMGEALKEAKKAELADEVPVGAVIVAEKQIIARAHNQIQLLQDVTAHAEIIAITSACSSLGVKYLNNCTIYVTLEPCLMCAGALYWSQIGRVVYGASDDKKGFMRYGREMLHPTTKLEYGVLHEKCGEIIKTFFQEKRKSLI